MPAALNMEGTLLLRVPRSLCQRRHENLHAPGGIVSRREIRLSLQYFGIVRT